MLREATGWFSAPVQIFEITLINLLVVKESGGIMHSVIDSYEAVDQLTKDSLIYVLKVLQESSEWYHQNDIVRQNVIVSQWIENEM